MDAQSREQYVQMRWRIVKLYAVVRLLREGGRPVAEIEKTVTAAHAIEEAIVYAYDVWRMGVQAGACGRGRRDRERREYYETAQKEMQARLENAMRRVGRTIVEASPVARQLWESEKIL